MARPPKFTGDAVTAPRACTKCLVVKDITEFRKHHLKKDGLASWCMECQRLQARIYKEKNREQVLEIRRLGMRRWREQNLALAKQRAKTKREDPRYQAWQSAYQKTYRQIHAERLKTKRAEWRQANWQKVINDSRLRRAMKRNAPGSYTPEDLQELFAAQHGLCMYCREWLGDRFHVDHKVPLARGGDNYLSNIQLLCRACNLKKWSRTHEEYLEALCLDESIKRGMNEPCSISMI